MNEFFEGIIKQVKEVAKIGDMPMGYIKGEDGKLILSAFATDKESIRLGLWLFKEQTKAKEIVLVNEAWYIGEKDRIEGKEIRENPKAKECFMVSYFTPDKVLIQQMPYKRIKKGKKDVLEWEKTDMDYNKCDKVESRFNPYTMTKEDVKEAMIHSHQEIIRINGKKEEHPMPFNHKIVIYRHKGEAFFEALDKNGNSFISIKPVKDDDKFRDEMEMVIKMLKSVKTLNK